MGRRAVVGTLPIEDNNPLLTSLVGQVFLRRFWDQTPGHRYWIHATLTEKWDIVLDGPDGWLFETTATKLKALFALKDWTAELSEWGSYRAQMHMVAEAAKYEEVAHVH